MTIHQQPIVIDPASIVAVGEMRARRSGRPKKGVVVEDGATTKTFKLSGQALASLTATAQALGVTESSVVEAVARALGGHFCKP